jgi:septum formation protein
MLVLASASPRRRELLTQAGFSFRVVPSTVPEDRLPGEDPIALATRLAQEKAQAVIDQKATSIDSPAHPLMVIGTDTVVVSGLEVLGKPSDSADAARMLRLLSGQTHHVITGVSLVSRLAAETAAEITYVTMRTLTGSEIEAYIASGEPMDKAGAYAIQGLASKFVERIDGCYFNVMGLPGEPADKAGAYAIQGHAGRWIPRIQGCYFNVVGLPIALVSALIEGMETRLDPRKREAHALSSASAPQAAAQD